MRKYACLAHVCVFSFVRRSTYEASGRRDLQFEQVRSFFNTKHKWNMTTNCDISQFSW